LAHRLGRLLARVHAAGFDIPELWSKHVLVQPRRAALTLIDWQRSRRRPSVPEPVRARDLAALHASLAEELATRRDRLTCLAAYLQASRVPYGLRPWAEAIRCRAERLRRRRSVREMCQPPLPEQAQRLRWVDGEALCAMRGFWRRCRGVLPDWVLSASREPARRPRQECHEWQGRSVILRQSPPVPSLRRWLARLRGRRVTSSPLRQAGLVFRLERFGVSGPRLLAFGQRPDGAGFVLLQPPAETIPLADWLGLPHPRRAEVLHQAGTLLRQVHEADCRLDDLTALAVCVAQAPAPVLSDVVSIHIGRLSRLAWLRDRDKAVHTLGLSGEDATAFLDGYERGELTPLFPRTQGEPTGTYRHA
jgi:hypothetical protein